MMIIKGDRILTKLVIMMARDDVRDGNDDDGGQETGMVSRKQRLKMMDR